MKKYLILLAISFFIIAPVAMAKTTATDALNEFGKSVYDDSNLTPKSPIQIVFDVIQIVLSVLGIIGVILVIYAGYQWMTSGGDSGKIQDAKNLLKAAVIGLLIILAAYSASAFVINSLVNAT